MALDHPPASEATETDYHTSCKVFANGRFQLLAQIPWQPQLLAPRVSDVARELGVPVLHEGQMHS
ncbi:hypothetical protein R0J93_28250, partial [Pseudoalteromonas sp. SIMBA_148]